jgi:phosphate transport system protein
VSEQPQELRIEYHRDLEAVAQKVVRLFALVCEAVAAANEALLGDDSEALAAVQAGEATIDALMLEIETDIERLLLLQAPMASELRYALAVIRIVPELERSGDLAEHIAKRAGSGLATQLTPTARGQLERMGTVAAQIWRAAADAFIDRDPTAGEALEAADDEIDDLHTALTRELLTGGLPAGVASEATLVARFYERLGDHAVHIASRVARAVA